MKKPELSDDLIDAWNMRFQNSEGIAYSNFSEICDQARLANALQRELDELRGRKADVEHVAWCRYLIEHQPTRIILCDSDDEGAFKVFRSPPEDESKDALAGRLIDVWVADKGKKIPWAKAVQIIAIVTKQPNDERDRLLRMSDDDDGKCGMCGRSDANSPAPISDLAMMLRRLIWQIRKRNINDDSLAVLAGKADDLLKVFRLQGSPLRDEPNAAQTEGKDKSLPDLAGFCIALFEQVDWPNGNGGEWDDLQELATKFGLLIPETRTESCGENCSCAEYHSDMSDGVTCYRKTPFLLAAQTEGKE